MKLLTEDLKKSLPSLDEMRDDPDPMVHAKFFTPDAHWTWYIVAFDGKDIFHGFVDGDFPEAGDFALSELESIRGPLGLKVERDKYFVPKPLSKIRSEVYRNRGWKR
ncbi:MAG: hypothetical protein AVO34_06780 [Firmicutes bacterium ML8_F2]|jgi:hypothetical protein|nr:MAG: hypothetical protein AVO34_06780 [Firmicutes bacterium ML8_F2]